MRLLNKVFLQEHPKNLRLLRVRITLVDGRSSILGWRGVLVALVFMGMSFHPVLGAMKSVLTFIFVHLADRFLGTVGFLN